jgi:metallophosphoesterase (TIGR00282 family)
MVKAIMIGDVVGEPGLLALEQRLPALIAENGADFTVVNGENAADGFGMTEPDLNRIFAAGADMVTSGNQVWDKRDFWPVMNSENRMLRPANYPEGSPGRGWAVIPKGSVSWMVLNLQGRELMTALDCPFKTADTILTNQGPATDIHPLLGADGSLFDELKNTGMLILVDFHAESTKEKEALGFYLDGRVSLVVGTHTHIQTADEKILPKGTGYITDLGMTGVSGVIGMDTQICLDRARTQVLYRMACAQPEPERPPKVQGIAAEFDQNTGRTISIRRIATTTPG